MRLGTYVTTHPEMALQQAELLRLGFVHSSCELSGQVHIRIAIFGYSASPDGLAMTPRF